MSANTYGRIELLPPDLSEERLRELCREMYENTGKSPSVGKMRNAARKHHAVLNQQKIAHAFATGGRVFLLCIDSVTRPEGTSNPARQGGAA